MSTMRARARARYIYIQKNRRNSLKERHKKFIAAVRKCGILAATKVKKRGSEKKRTEIHTTFPL